MTRDHRCATKLTLTEAVGLLLLIFWTMTFTSLVSVGATTTMPDENQGQVLDLISNLFLTGGDDSKTTKVLTDGLAKCVYLCYRDESCYSLSLNKTDGWCYLNTITSISVNARAVFDQNFVYTEIRRDKSWFMAFRATSNIGISVYDTWNNVGHHHDVTAVSANDYGCLTGDGRLPCNKHFRSWRMDAWKNVHKVRFMFYTEGRGVFRVQRRDVGLADNITDAFTSGFIVQSYQDILYSYTGAFNYYSVEGYSECQRRFYINQAFGGCANDVGWMMVSDEDNSDPACCSYETLGTFPNFLYSMTGQAVTWNNASAVGVADVFMVAIKYNN